MVAEIVSDLIRLRTKEGMKVAKVKARLCGKQPKVNTRQEAHSVVVLRARSVYGHRCAHPRFRLARPEGRPRRLVGAGGHSGDHGRQDQSTGGCGVAQQPERREGAARVLPIRGPDAHWVRAEGEHARFGIAFDLLGDGSRILVADQPATVAALTIRLPEPHPGLIARPVMLGIEVDSGLTRD
jgi:hypothetical protein